MFPYAELVLYTLLMIAWIEKHPSCKLLLSIAGAWLVGKVAEGFTYGRPWHIQWEWIAVLLIIWLWAASKREKGYLALFITTLTISGQYLFILNEPGIIPYQGLFFPLMVIVIAYILGNTYWEIAFALSGALLISQIIIPFSFDGMVRYLQLPEPHYFHSILVFLSLLAVLKRHQLWPMLDTNNENRELFDERGQFDLTDQ